MPAPLTFLAAAGQRTGRLALGTAVIALPFEHPLGLAGAASVTDALTAGRLRLGLGAGDSDTAFVAFGLDPDTRSRRFRTQLARLLSAFEGRGGIAGTVLHPPLDRSPQSMIWVAAQSVETAILAGRHYLGLLLRRVAPGGGSPAAHQRALARAFRDAGGTRVTVARSAWLTGDPLSDPELAGALDRFATASARRRGVGPARVPVEIALERYHVIAGPGPRVADALRADLAGIDPDEVLLTLDPGGLPPGRAVERLDQAAAELFPLLR